MRALDLHRTLALVLAFFLVMAFTLTAEARPSNKWRIHFNGKADKDGHYTVKIEPEDGKPEIIKIEVKKGTRENEAARECRTRLTRELKGYDVDKDDGEEVVVRARIGTADFELDIEENVKGLSIRPDRK